MNTEEIKSKVNNVLIDQLGFNEKKLKDDSNIVDDLGADSLDSVEIIMAVEDEFDIEITDEEFMKVKTVLDLYKLVEVKA